ncbi:MAG TPA: hypothetical protein VEK32_17680 [Thermodesulfobacteriota bacterium]|nr:hypothetical protein [Thermodesulfobacteriota bacterium]
MSAVEHFNQALTKFERQMMARLTTPRKIQYFLDGLPYSLETIYRCPLRVLRDRVAHCYDGALFGAAALRCLGYPPLILNMPAILHDDDHLLALYKRDGRWGAVAKSNFVGLRFREPIYVTLHELVMSYFEQFYNVERKKTLRSYTVPLNLKAFDKLNWMTSDAPLERIGARLDEIRKVRLLTRRMIANLSLVDERSYQAGLLGANKEGLYKPPAKRHKKG